MYCKSGHLLLLKIVSTVIENRGSCYKSEKIYYKSVQLLQIGQNIANECTITGKKGARLLLIVTLDIES